MCGLEETSAMLITGRAETYHSTLFPLRVEAVGDESKGSTSRRSVTLGDDILDETSIVDRLG